VLPSEVYQTEPKPQSPPPLQSPSRTVRVDYILLVQSARSILASNDKSMFHRNVLHLIIIVVLYLLPSFMYLDIIQTVSFPYVYASVVAVNIFYQTLFFCNVKFDLYSSYLCRCQMYCLNLLTNKTFFIKKKTRPTSRLYIEAMSLAKLTIDATMAPNNTTTLHVSNIKHLPSRPHCIMLPIPVAANIVDKTPLHQQIPLDLTYCITMLPRAADHTLIR
jgi:hypothetical protein